MGQLTGVAFVAEAGQWLERSGGPHRAQEDDMPRYLIERELPGAGKLSADELHGISRKSNEVLAGMGGRAHWVESYVTDDAITCVYIADSPEAVREHASAGGFPATNIREVRTVIDPLTGA
jgi:hypothetical protein